MRVSRPSEATPIVPPAAPELDAPTSAALPTAEPAALHSAGTTSPRFGQVLRGLGQELDRGENLTEKAIRGGAGHASPDRLIALQAGIYRYSEAVDLVTKLVDKGTQAVRTTLQNQ
jgi:hypothetical protein